MARTKRQKTWRDLVPTSKAKTAYGLLSDIAKLAQEEPARMRMDCWGGRPGTYTVISRVPACRTVGCIGGWTEVLRPKKRAARTLGLTNAQELELFYGPLCLEDNQGTRRHASRVVSLISRFQKKYRTQLLTKKV